MKTASNQMFAQLSQKTLSTLTTVVKETIATGYLEGQHKIFSAADLWNIQRQRRARTQRRYF